MYRRVVVGGGHVLRLTGVFRDLNSPAGGAPALNYAQCVNYRNEVSGHGHQAGTDPTVCGRAWVGLGDCE